MIPTAATPAPTRGFNVRLASLRKEAAWTDVMNKAKRLIQTGNVTVLVNRPHHVMAHVQGDHGAYDCEITRTDPNSQIIEQWHCECPWDQYAFDRTRKWKKYEGRPCSHVLAAYWRAKSVPLDITDQDEGYQAPRGQRLRDFSPEEQAAHDQQLQQYNDKILGPMSEDDADAGNLPRSFGPDDVAPMTGPSIPEMRQQIQQMPVGQPQTAPEQPVNPFLTPKQRKRPNLRKPGPDQLSLFDITAPPGGQPVPPTNPVSIPGINPPGWENPGNPTQFPGTFSHVAARAGGGTFLCPEHGEIPGEKVMDDEQGFTCFWCGQGVKSVRTAAADYAPGQDVLIDVQLGLYGSQPTDWYPARIVRHIPDTEGEAWDEDDYEIQWTGEVPEDEYVKRWTKDGLIEVPESWVNPPADRGAPANMSVASFDHFPPIFHLATDTFVYAAGNDVENWYNACKQNRVKPIFQLRKTVHLQARGGKIPMPGAQPIDVTKDGLPKYKLLDLGWDPQSKQRIPSNHPQFPNGAPENQDLSADVRAGRRGEVTDIEPFLKMVHVQVPINDTGPLHPHLFQGWVSYDDIVPLDTLKDPFRARR